MASDEARSVTVREKAPPTLVSGTAVFWREARPWSLAVA